MLTGSQEAGRKKQLRQHIAQGNAQLVIGTHALIQETVEFDKLGLVIVDEQHRFGVMQRFRLMKKSDEAEPDVLVMTATPIPRTLALTIYGDLDTSVLDELPPGTHADHNAPALGDERADEVWEFVRKQVAAGHQAYIVYPVIEEGRNATGELKAAIKMHERLRSHEFSSLHVGLLHGRMSADDKDATMASFKRGEIDVLVSTTVIEVGVDVPNANVMVIEHAERFGLSQMHQLRGRIGRGAAKSYCVLMTGGKVSIEAQQRLDAMVRTQDGFEIAELDLEQRGPGEFFGTRQAGMPNFRVANLLRDRDLLEAARKEARYVLAGPNADVTQGGDRPCGAPSAQPLEPAVWTGRSRVTRDERTVPAGTRSFFIDGYPRTSFWAKLSRPAGRDGSVGVAACIAIKNVLPPDRRGKSGAASTARPEWPAVPHYRRKAGPSTPAEAIGRDDTSRQQTALASNNNLKHPISEGGFHARS